MSAPVKSIDSLDSIPEYRSGSKLDKIHFAQGENISLVCLYQNSSDFNVYDIKTQQTNIMAAPNKAACRCQGKSVNKNIFFAFHECQNAIQMCKTDTRQLFHITQESGILKDIRAIVFNERVLVGIAIKKIVIWGIQATSLGPPITAILESSPSITAINELRSILLSDTKLLLVNNNPGGHCFQVWNIPPTDDLSITPSLYCYAEISNKTDTLISFSQCENHVVTSTNEGFQIWDITQKGKLVPRKVVLENHMCVTTIFTDQHFLIIGDNLGDVFLYDYQGYCLNGFTVPGIAVETDIRSVELSKLKTLFQHKINKITRVGRHIIALCENGFCKLFDLFSLRRSAVEELRELKTSFRDFRWKFENDKLILYLLCSTTVEDSTLRTALIKWEPKTNVIDINTPTEIFEKTFADFIRLVETNELKEDDKADIDRIVVSLRDTREPQNIPFIVFQDLIFAIDEYSALISKSTKSSQVRTRAGVSTEAEKVHTALTHAFGVYSQVYRALKFPQALQRKQDDMKKLIDDQLSSSIALTSLTSDEQITPLLGKIINSLEKTSSELISYIENFNDTCNAGIKDPDKVLPLLDIYVKLKQYAEDTKEIGKTIGMFRGDNPVGQWWENGGRYDE